MKEYRLLEEQFEEFLNEYARTKTKVKVTFESGKTKWGWVHNYYGQWYLTRGNRVGFSLDTATKIEVID